MTEVERSRSLAGLGGYAKSGVTMKECRTFADPSVTALPAAVKTGWAIPSEKARSRHFGCLVYNTKMAKPDRDRFPFPPKRVYFGAEVPRRLIHRYARAIAAEFHPERILLFGSFAYGTPHEESDVDLLVVMHTADPHSARVRIQYRLTPPFPLDLLVRTPEQLARRLARGDSFLRTILSQGKVLYEKVDARVGPQGRKRLRPGRARQSERHSPS